MNNKRVLELFREISNIPRCSNDERAISDYLVQKASDLGMSHYRDDSNNVIIKKPGSKGYEDHAGVILQGHMDMVCEKTKDSKHDFTCEPIEWIEEHGMLRANGTTLGADNGIALAMGLAILEDPNLKHPPLELLVTTGEEIGLIGANALAEDVLEGKYLINIDSEEEGIMTCGCAGGTTVITKLPIHREAYGKYQYKITIGNLLGGHSGSDIEKPRVNAIKVMIHVLKNISKPFRIVMFSGGTKHNAIPRDCEVVISSDDVIYFDQKLVDAFREVEPGISFDAKEVSSEQLPLTKESTEEVIHLIDSIKHGIYRIENEKVVTSANVAIVELTEDECIQTTSIRSSYQKEIDEIVVTITELAKGCNAQSVSEGSYTPWEYVENSRLRDIANRVYKEMTGKDFVIDIIHAGLECAVFQKKYETLDMISIGPDMKDVHTPNEILDLESTDRVYDYLVKLLGEL